VSDYTKTFTKDFREQSTNGAHTVHLNGAAPVDGEMLTLAEKLFSLYFRDSKYYARAFTAPKYGYAPVEEAPTVKNVMDHLGGGLAIGDYTVRDGNVVWYFGWDIDCEGDLPKSRTWAKSISQFLRLLRIPHATFFSGNKGYHIIVFLSRSMPAEGARAFTLAVCDHLKIPTSGTKDKELGVTHKVECYPKQAKKTKVGNLIKLPGCKHPTSGRRSVAVSPLTDRWEDNPLPNLVEGTVQIEPSFVLATMSFVERPILEVVELVLPYWVQGQRHELGLALIGWLVKSGWKREEIEAFSEELVNQSGSDEKAMAARIESTYKKLEVSGVESLTGVSGVEKVLGKTEGTELDEPEQEFLSRLHDLLEGEDVPRRASLEVILSQLEDIVPGVENTPLGESLAWLTAPESKIVAQNVKESRPTDRDAYNKTISIIAKCRKALRAKSNQKLSAGRPIIEIAEAALDDMRAQFIAAIHRANKLDHRYPYVYVYNGRLARIVQDEEGQLVAKLLSMSALRGIAADVALWTQDRRPTIPHKVVVEDLLSYDRWDFPGLKRLTAHPVLLPDGTIDNKEGYSPQTKLFIEGGIILGDTNPTPVNLVAAKALLLDFWLADFPFDSQASRANALGLMLLPFVRDLFDGATPLHLIDSAVARTGKTLLADLYSFLTTGMSGSHTTLPEEESEVRKKITGLLLAGRSIISLDNVAIGRVIDSEALASYLTAGRSSDRVLGTSDTPTFKNYATWMAMGNNLQAAGEIVGRSVWIRLDANMERPELRTGFKCENIRQWTRENRGVLCTALLTLCRKWVADGKPMYKGPAKGGFEEWIGTIGGILQSAGVEGFLGNSEELQQTSNPQEVAWRAFVQIWWERYGSNPVTMDELFPIASRRDSVSHQTIGFGTERAIPLERESSLEEDLNLLESELKASKEMGRRSRLATLLGGRKGAVLNGCKIEKGSRSNNKQQWFLKRVG